MAVDADYMGRALDLAALGREWVSPNPMVGCVIVQNNQIIGEGFHQKYGENHAEVNAIQSVKDKSLLEGSTVYVTLEPCNHYGKTPPCTNILIESKVKKIIICDVDPSPKVSGRGIERLRQAGIEVEVGLLQERGKKLNQRFFKAHQTGIPYIILKWAETADGYISKEDKSPVKISNTTTDVTVHRWRAEEDAILVGKNTVISDNPRLNVRHWMEGKNPVRVILDSQLEIPSNYNIFDDTQPTLVFNDLKAEKYGNTEWIQTTEWQAVFKILKEKGIFSVLVEGGKKTLESLMELQLFDEIRVIKSDFILGKGYEAPRLSPPLILEHNTRILNNQIFYYKNPRSAF